MNSTHTDTTETVERKPELRLDSETLTPSEQTPNGNRLCLSDWQQAKIMGKRAFYERSTNTIRACPENWCLAVRTESGWQRYGRDSATRQWWSALDKTLDNFGKWSTGDALAAELGKALA
jgi:hypothetical protein